MNLRKLSDKELLEELENTPTDDRKRISAILDEIDRRDIEDNRKLAGE